MELNSGNSETISSKSTYEEDTLKTHQDESSNSLTIKNLNSKNKNNSDNIKIDKIIQSKEENSPEIIPYANSQLTLKSNKINPQKNRYPYCIVWAPIPFLTYLIPCIGHVGIANSEGIIYDFAGTYYVSIDDFSFGKPTKYIQLDLTDKERYEYDKAIQNGYNKYKLEIYNLLRNNCHSHVSYVLNQLNYRGKNNYNMFDIWLLLIEKGKYISFLSFIKTYIGFFIFFLIIGLAIR